jgi:hypothetical protein
MNNISLFFPKQTAQLYIIHPFGAIPMSEKLDYLYKLLA